MDHLTDFALNEEYKHLQSVGDKLAEIESLIDWKSFRPISCFHITYNTILNIYPK